MRGISFPGLHHSLGGQLACGELRHRLCLEEAEEVCATQGDNLGSSDMIPLCSFSINLLRREI